MRTNLPVRGRLPRRRHVHGVRHLRGVCRNGNPRHGREALQTVIPALVERGYELVTVSTLLNLPPLEEEEELFDWHAFKKSVDR